MKTNKIFSIIALSTIVLFFPSCKDYLTEQSPGTTTLADFFTSTEAATQAVTAAYVPLMWEFNETFCSEWFIGDIASDDALKGGGSTSDMADAYDIENWRTTSQNTLLKDYYRAQYQGIGRANLAIANIEKMEVKMDNNFTQEMKNRLLGEGYFLRGFYYFRMLRIFGGVPLITAPLDDSDQWGQNRASVDEMFNQILADFTKAASLLPEKSSSLYKDADLGRATKGAAQAMLMKTNLYMASKYWSKQVTKSVAQCYEDAYKYGKLVIDSHEYELCPNYEDNFTVAGENGIESVFEIQYAEVEWGAYSGDSDPIHFGYTAGSFTQILTRSRSGKIGGGWGFNHPTQNLYNEFEAGDPRREVSILDPRNTEYLNACTGKSETSYVENPSEEAYLGSFLLNNKYAMYRDSIDAKGGYGMWKYHAARGPLNNKQIRYADVLLMTAEAALGMGNADEAKNLINEVRERAGLADINVADEAALRHERRCELAMEGHRWFDLVRWEGVEGNGLKAHMDAYKAQETPEAQSHIQEFVAGKHELFPIPQEEIQLNPNTMSQNNGY